MIHYNVWFSFKDGTDEPGGIARVATFLEELKQRNSIHDFKLLKTRAEADDTRLARFQALILFVNQEQFNRPFQEVTAIGVHAGQHGRMIENVDTFIVEVFEELPSG